MDQKYKINFLHICEYAFFSEDKKLSVINVFDKIKTQGFPAIHPRFCIVVNMSGPLDGTSRMIEINDSAGNNIVTAESNSKLDPKKETTHWIINLINTKFHKADDYKIVIRVDGKQINEDRSKIDKFSVDT